MYIKSHYKYHTSMGFSEIIHELYVDLYGLYGLYIYGYVYIDMIYGSIYDLINGFVYEFNIYGFIYWN